MKRRRLALIPCYEPVEAMDAVQGGRHCHRCALVVRHTANLGQEQFRAAMAQVGQQRVCAELRVSRGGVRLRGGALAAGISLVVLSGCAPHDGEWERLLDSDPDGVREEDGAGPEPSEQGCEIRPQPDGTPVADGPATRDGSRIAGVVTDSNGARLPGAILVVDGPALEEPLEAYTNEHGLYGFRNLPPGDYEVQVLHGRSNVSKALTLAAKAKARVNFRIASIDRVLRGVVVEVSPIDTTTASSTLVID